MASSQLLTPCLITDGFPENLGPNDVANFFKQTKGVPVLRVAPSPSGRSWVFQVGSQADQEKCLSTRTSFLTLEGKNYAITLNVPEIKDIPAQDAWTSTAEREVPETKKVDVTKRSSSEKPVEIFEVTDSSPEEPETGTDADSIYHSPNLEPRRQHFLRVTDLPLAVNESVLQKYFQDRRNGGGPVDGIELVTSAGEAAIYFKDDETIERVVKKSPHLLMNKKIKVEFASESKDHVNVQESRTVDVRSVADETTKEMCLLYFENASKGGGDIEDSNWNEQEKVLYITFVDATVAQQVTTRGHTVGGKVLEVTLYTPPPLIEDKGQCTVEVRGFDPQNLALYQLYFDNPRKIGGTVTDFQVSEDNDVIYITFQSPEEAEQVANATHKVGKTEVFVTLAPKEDPMPSQHCTIKIVKCDLTQVELYSLYFENSKKSGGGSIKDTRVNEKERAVYITFEDPETVDRVCSRAHSVANHDLQVVKHVPEKTKGQKLVDMGEKKEAQKEPTRTIEVKVGNKMMSEDTYTLYFESKGDVKKLEIDEKKGIVHVTFSTPDVAAKVASQQHKICGQLVEVTLYVPPVPKPSYPNKLLFHNVADSTVRDTLVLYLERITGQEPTDLIYADQLGDVLAVFDEEQDFLKVQEKCRGKKLEGRQISVSKVPISDCILVENVNENTTEDTIILYFEGKRSGGGPVRNVVLDHDTERCFVFFENHEVIENILAKTHTLNGNKLKAKLYTECLGPSGGSRDASTFTIPRPMEFKDVDKHKLAFIQQSATLQEELIKKLTALHAKMSFSDNTLSVECTLTTSVQGARMLARTWTNDVQDAVHSFFNTIAVLCQEVMQEIWDETEKDVAANKPATHDLAVIVTLKENKSFIVVGEKSMADDLMQKVKQIVIRKEEEAERKKEEITETNKSLKPYQLHLLAAGPFQGQVTTQNPGLKVDICTTKGEISFHGLVRDVKAAQVEMYNMLQSVKSDKLTNMTDLQKTLLSFKETRDYVVKKFKAEKNMTVWDINSQGEITVYAFDDNDLVGAIHIMQKSIVQHQRPLELETADLVTSSEWTQFVGRLTSDHPGVLKILDNGQQLFIAGTDNIMHAVIEDTERFFTENTIYTMPCHFSASRQTFLTSFWQDKVIDICNNLRAYKVEVSAIEPGQKFHMRGTEKGLDQMVKMLERLASGVKCRTETITDEAKVKFLSSPSCEGDLEKLGSAVRCVFSLKEEPTDLVIEKSRSTHSVFNESPTEERTPAITMQLQNGVTVMAVQRDITNLNVDVIVNAANSHLSHGEGLAKHIVQKGGKEIQDECSSYIKSRGGDLTEGDIFMSRPGKLSCKAIIHAVGPKYSGGNRGEDNCLHDLVVKCMESANADGFSSIAIPALSAGIFHYPPKEATHVIIEGAWTYLKEHRETHLKFVYLCDIVPNTVKHFVTAIQEVFPSNATVKQKPTSPKPTNDGKSITRLNTVAPLDGQRVIRISVIEGEIAQQDTDIIVNSTSVDLELKNGAVRLHIEGCRAWVAGGV